MFSLDLCTFAACHIGIDCRAWGWRGSVATVQLRADLIRDHLRVRHVKTDQESSCAAPVMTIDDQEIDFNWFHHISFTSQWPSSLLVLSLPGIQLHAHQGGVPQPSRGRNVRNFKHRQQENVTCFSITAVTPSSFVGILVSEIGRYLASWTLRLMPLGSFGNSCMLGNPSLGNLFV